MAEITPELAAENAAAILAEAERAGNERAIALATVADAWTRLHTALSRASGKVLMPEMAIYEAEIDGVDVVIVPEKGHRLLVALGWTPPTDDQ